MSEQSIFALERSVRDICDEIRDFHTLIALNLEALALHSTPKQQSLITQMRDVLLETAETYKECQDIRLNLLITQQITSEQVNLRKERLQEYEEKIQEQRRLVSDKEQNFHAMRHPRKRKPDNLTPEEFERMRIAEKNKQNLLFMDKYIKDLEEIRLFNLMLSKQQKKLAKQYKDISSFAKELDFTLEYIEEITKKPENYLLYLNSSGPENSILDDNYSAPKLSKKTYVDYAEILKEGEFNLDDEIQVLVSKQYSNFKLTLKLEEEYELTKYLERENEYLLDKFNLAQPISLTKQSIQKDHNNSTAVDCFVEEAEQAAVRPNPSGGHQRKSSKHSISSGAPGHRRTNTQLKNKNHQRNISSLTIRQMEAGLNEGEVDVVKGVASMSKIKVDLQRSQRGEAKSPEKKKDIQHRWEVYSNY